MRLSIPTIETLFYDIFKNIGELIAGDYPKSVNDRIKDIEPRLIWDCHYYVNNGVPKENLIAGIQQLVTITGFNEYLPDDYFKIIEALFLYRNMMFHNGLEWPEENLENFNKQIELKKYMKEWFTCSTRDSKPWIYYMTKVFIDRCIKFINEIEIAAGAFYIENY